MAPETHKFSFESGNAGWCLMLLAGRNLIQQPWIVFVRYWYWFHLPVLFYCFALMPGWNNLYAGTIYDLRLLRTQRRATVAVLVCGSAIPLRSSPDLGCGLTR
jgi:hypothetical protein